MESLPQGMQRQPWLQRLVGLHQSHACCRAGAAGPSVPRVCGQAAPGLFSWFGQPAWGLLASLSSQVAGSGLGTLRTAGPGSPEPSSHNSSHQLELDWENSHLSQRVNALLSRGDWKPLPGRPCSLEVKVLLCTSSHLR